MHIKPWGIGLFLVVGLGLFTAILFIIGNQDKAFRKHVNVYAEFSNLSGIATGAKVRVSGFDAGEIESIGIPGSPSGKFRLKLQIEKRLIGMVREDSLVSIETDGVVGDKFVSVAKGAEGSEEAKEGTTLRGKEPLDMTALMEKGSALIGVLNGTVRDITGRADLALDSVTRTVNRTDGLIAGITPGVNRIVATTGRATAGVETLVNGLNGGRGAAGLLLADDATKHQLSATLTSVHDASTNLQEAAVGVNKTVADFRSRDLIANAQVSLDNVQALSGQLKVSVAGALAKDDLGQDGATNIRQTLSGLNRATTNLAEDTEALKHEFFFRGFFKKRGFYNLDDVTPAEYLKASAHRKDKGNREWLQASSLVVTDGDGREQLSEEGRQQIDAQVAPFVEALPGDVIIVEGYSTFGSPDRQFVVSRRRADLVRLYLEAHFKVRHSDIGIVPLLKPPPDAGRDTWNGAAIMLFKADAKK
jgi:phospholipid/cholesterol/gamma-HCH transport system substrate-binding protein